LSVTLIEHSECTQCGATIEVTPGKAMTVTFVGRSGQPNERVLAVDGKEIHRCEVSRRA
jgi:ssDNA-binding Zn-finger/Zn-ribbon topoisomerase 1